MLRIDLEFLIRKTMVRLNLKIDLGSLHISPRQTPVKHFFLFSYENSDYFLSHFGLVSWDKILAFPVNQISAKQGSNSRFVIEANTKALKQ